jgi:proline iminopeptidase
MKKLSFCLVVILFLCNSCRKEKEKISFDAATYFTYGDEPESGGVRLIPISTPEGEYNVWTKRFGNNPKIKILLLHGGPGMTHEYMECFETFFQREGFEFYEYDQLGSYFSDKPKDPSLWNIERFVSEVDQVRRAIGADSSNFYIIGNSWGGVLGMEYALKHQNHMKGLIVANMMASVPEYNNYSKKLAGQLPPEILKEIKTLEEKKDFENPRYMELLMTHYYPKHICRLKNWPDAAMRSFTHVNHDIYTLMQGPSEMGIIGDAVLSNWDIKNRLPEITVPTLMVGAEHDTMDPKAMEEQSKLVKNGQYLHCPNGSHLAMWDDQKVFMKGVIDFVKGVANN